MEVLLNLEAVIGEHDLKGLRSLQNEVEASVRSLKALGVSSEYGTMLTPVLLTKLPPAIRLIVSRKITDADLNLETLQTALEEELVARERSRDPTRNVKRTHNHMPATATTLLSETQGFDGKQMCCYCQQTHSSGDCQVVKDINTRKQILKTSGRCFNCLRKGHIGKKCCTTPQCRSCNRKHHPSICDESASVKNVVSNQTNPRNITTPLNPSALAFVSTDTTTAMCSTQVKSVLLQTARALVCNPVRPDIPIQMRVLLDSGSQRRI